MRYSKTHKEETRRRILDEAKRLFRERGASSVGIGELMSTLGLTPGGFYAHFQSKDALVAECCFEAFLDTATATLTQVSAQPHGQALSNWLDYYLSTEHCENPGSGCVMPAMAAEVARGSTEVRHAFTQGLKAWLKMLDPLLPGGDGRPYERGDALAAVACMVGSMTLARAVDDETLRDRILREAAAFLRGTQAPPAPAKRRAGSVRLSASNSA